MPCFTQNIIGLKYQLFLVLKHNKKKWQQTHETGLRLLFSNRQKKECGHRRTPSKLFIITFRYGLNLIQKFFLLLSKQSIHRYSLHSPQYVLSIAQHSSNLFHS